MSGSMSEKKSRVSQFRRSRKIENKMEYFKLYHSDTMSKLCLKQQKKTNEMK